MPGVALDAIEAALGKMEGYASPVPDQRPAVGVPTGRVNSSAISHSTLPFARMQLAYFWLTTLIHVWRASRCVGPQRSAQDPDSLAADEISGDIHVREEALPVITSNNNKRRRLRLFKNSSYSVVGRKQVGSVVEDWSLEVQN
jgi:hypothetical protein